MKQDLSLRIFQTHNTLLWLRIIRNSESKRKVMKIDTLAVGKDCATLEQSDIDDI